jgi:L-fucose mutarotase/ribose pyranase (RbsD/FucU family)
MFATRLIAVVCVLSAATGAGAGELNETLKQRLPRLGHRNWIVIADAAYPAQSRPGIETVYVGGDQIEAVTAVLQAIQSSKHVRAKVLLDAELTAVPEGDAPGVTRYRDQLQKLLEVLKPERLPHETIIGKLDDTAKTFEVLIIKTDFTIPYTTVFLQLDCGYWNADAEQRLRQSLQDK